VESSWVHGRDQDAYHSTLRSSNVLVIGCGSVGSQVAIRLAQAGIGSMTLLDPEPLESANVGRHALGMDSLGKSKAQELSSVLRKRFPHMIKVHGDKKRWQGYLTENPSMLNSFDLIIACLGEWSEEALLNEWHRRSKSCTPIVYGWLDERATAAHAVALTGEGLSLNCIIEDDTLRIHETIWDNSEKSVYAEPACGNLFQPYGAIDVLYAEGLIAKLCLDVLLGNVKAPKHRIYACSTENLRRLGGEWSPEHLKYRPENYDGSFEYERKIESCGQCRDCKGGE
jgi:molybdopterin/thiamine biosynthesis adenylyltransferase